MQLSHRLGRTSAVFDDPNLVSSAGLVPGLALATAAGLRDLADEQLSVPTGKGANAGLKVTSLVAGVAAGGDSTDNMGLLQHGEWAGSSLTRTAVDAGPGPAGRSRSGTSASLTRSPQGSYSP